MGKISKEATLREVLAEVSVLDLGGQIKTVLASIGCLGVFLVISSGIGAGVSAIAPDLTVPDVVWRAMLVFIFVMAFTENKSYHEFRFEWYFPKLGFGGWVTLTAYIVGVWEAFELAAGIQETMPQYIAIGFVWLILLLPFFLFLGILEVGHKRLVEKRR